MFSKNSIAARILLASVVMTMAYTPFANAQRSKKGAKPSAEGPSSSPSAPAPTGTSDATAAATEEKLDVSDLERKYWAAKDTDFSVVQNRLFSKAGRYALTANYGTMLNDSWSDGPTLGLSASYYFSERYGAEIAYSNTASKNNQAADRLTSQGGVPDHNKMKQFYGAAFNWVPFYAKMSVLNSQILYFDMSVSPGLGMVEYEQQINTGNELKTTPAFTLDVTQHFFISNNLALRIDYKNRWYQEDVVTFRPQTGGTRNTNSELTNKNLLMFGVTVYF